jgi:hypothetical protein
MVISAEGERLYERKDLTDEFIVEITHDLFEYGNVYGKNRTYINDFFTMDIETTSIRRKTDALAFTYSIAVYITGKCLLFREWKDYNEFIYKLNGRLKLNKYYRLVCYVHNLPYEFQFMRDFMHIDDVFATQPRKVVKGFSNGIEYRCSYKLTNMGLAKFTTSIPNLPHVKLSGDDFDYSVFRTPKTTLLPEELDYIFNDVAGLYEALDYTIKHDNYNLATIPNTSTGFVRDEMRYQMGQNPVNRRQFLKMSLNQLSYGLCRTARRGGNTHCTPIYSDATLPNLTSMDMSSAYPAVMIEKMFPMSPFVFVAERRVPDFEEFIGTFACILDLTFYDLEVKTMDTIPYIPKAHCTGFPKFKKHEREFEKTQKWKDIEFLSDNGRVLKAKELSMVITDIDYQIIKETYKFRDVKCRICMIADYGYLPDELRKTILRQYEDKTKLKDQDPYMYMKQKNKFNANFGCMLTDICQDNVVYHEGSTTPFSYEKEASFQEQLDRYYSSRNSFLSYQHGLWVTAWCRLRLQKAINKLGTDMVYCDTDSVKFFDTPENRAIFKELNEEVMGDIAQCGLDCSVEYKGKTYTLGVWEPDGDYELFKSMGAKKYAYIAKEDYKCNPKKYGCGHCVKDCEDACKECNHCGDNCRFKVNGICWWKKFQITVAGLSKTKAKEYMFDQAFDPNNPEALLDYFEVDTIIPAEHSGRTTATYNDYESVRVLRLENGEIISVGSNMVIEDATYKFTFSEDYDNLLKGINEGVIY